MNLFRTLLLLLQLFFTAELIMGQNGFKDEPHGTDLKFKKISVENGLSQSTVFCILKDSKGFMWFGTRGGGLNKYDGYNFTVYKNNPNDSSSLSNNEVISLLEDHTGKLWIGTRKGGLNKYNATNESFIQYRESDNPESIRGNTVNVIFEDSKYNLWIGTSAGLNLYKNGKFIHNAVPEITDQHITSIDEDSQGNLYISDKKGLFVYYSKANKTVYIENKDITQEASNSNYSIPILVDSKNKKWIGSSYGLRLLKNDNSLVNFEDYFELNWGPASETRQIIEDKKGNLWIGTLQGLFKYNPTTRKLELFQKDENDPLSLSHNSIYSIYEDNTGTIWIGTWGGGVNMLTDKLLKFEHHNHQSFNPQSLSNNVVSSFEEDENGIWIGTELGGLNFLKSGSNQFIHYQQNESDKYALSSNHIKTLCHDSKGRLWIGTFGAGLNLMDKETGKFRQFLDGGKIFSLVEGPEGFLWVGTMHGLYRFNYEKKEWKQYNYKPNDNNSLSHSFVNVMFVDSGKNLWIGTKEAGLMKYNKTGDNFIRYHNIPNDTTSLLSNYVISINEGTEGELLIGTNNGLCQYNYATDNFAAIEIPGLPDKNINGILCDTKKNYWISTNNGITKYSSDGPSINYDINDGLQSREFNRSSYFKSSSGKFYFGGINGFNAFYPDIIPVNNEVPAIIVTDFKISNRSAKPLEKGSPLTHPISDTKEITLRHDQSDFSFEFVALNYIAPEKNKYSYKLEGYNSKWINANNNRTATYTNIKPGNYTFRVKGANNDNVWNNEGVAIKLRIKPPIWKTFAAYITYALLLISFLALFRKIITFRIEQQNILKNERLEKKRIEELNQMKLRFFTNVAHEFRTPLTLISGPLSKMSSYHNDNEEQKYLMSIVQNNVKRLLVLVNELMDFRKAENEKLKLHISNSDIADFLNDLIECFRENAMVKNIILDFQYELNGQKESWFDNGVLDKVVFNLLSNAIKYTPNDGEINVLLEIVNKHAVIKVKDSGNGIPKNELSNVFDRFYQVEEEKSNISGTGIGLAFAKRLIEAHKGTIEVESTMGKGSTFIVNIPISKDAYPEKYLASGEGKKLEVLKETIPNSVKGEKTVETVEKSNNKILIVEDNDELREYLESQFKNYHISTAKNGKSGLKTAQKEIPDIIISDIMMPEMDGLEMCTHLKTQFSTSHIPIILLTAKTEMSQKIEGIETGADAYIEKPFDLQFLEATIKNLLNQRKALRKRYAENLDSDIDEIPINPHEKRFIEKVNKLIEKNISNPDFSVENLALELGMSRSQLFRKFRASFELSPSEIIRIERLKYSKKLLSGGEYNINEIADLVGFKSSSYFITSFKKHFGITPNDYLKELLNK